MNFFNRYNSLSNVAFPLLCFLFLSNFVNGQTQTTITIDECYQLARQQYPLIKQLDLIKKTKEYNIQNAAKGYYPQFSVNGQATYQSDVTTIPLKLDIPQIGLNFDVPSPKKDQYKISAQVDQLIYDGGGIKYSKQSEEANEKIQEQSLEVELFTLKKRVNDLFFGILLIDEQLRQNELLQKDLQSSIDRMQERLKNGMATQSSLSELQAGLIQQQQNRIQLSANRKAYIDILGAFTNKQYTETVRLEEPGNPVLSDSIHRPELSLYDAQNSLYSIQNKFLNVSNRPKFSFFLQGGYARPGLNAFDVDFATYYIGGLKLNWQFGGLYTLRNQRNVLDIKKQSTDIQKETFLFNTSLLLKQQRSDITRLREIIELDKDIILKRTDVKNASKAQMENGVVTIHEYISQLIAEDQAQQSLLLHQIQLLMAEYNYQNTTGN